MAKQTAANNQLLKDIKDAMNKHVYSTCLRLVNEGNDLGKLEQGEQNALAYLKTFFNGDNPFASVQETAAIVRKGRK